jgi:hypothetical protein
MKRLKEAIKADIMGFLLVCFLLGAGFIWLGSAYGWLRLSDGDKVNSTVLWLTALAIFWYAYEAYQLKLSNTNQAELQEVIMQNEFLPILEPVATRASGAVLRGGNFSGLQVRNLGKGPAKYIEIVVAGVHAELEWSLASGEHEILRLPPAVRAQVKAAMAEQPAKVSLRLIYQDIYKRKFQTEHVAFERKPRGEYRLRQGSWDFKRLRH